jgi:hypothetical protein
MAATTVATDFYSAQADVAVSRAAQYGGRERAMVMVHTTTAQETGSTIKLCQIPKGAIVTDITVDAELIAASSTLTFKVGSTAVSSALASSAALAQRVDLLVALGATALTADTDLTILTGGATLAASKDIVVTVRYVLD